MASEIDLPWTYLGGSHELIREVLTHSHLEALPALPGDPTTPRAPAWLQAKVQTAVDELLRHGETEVETSVGTVRASLRAPTRRRAGRLRIERYRLVDEGASGGWSETMLSAGSMDISVDRLRQSTYCYLLSGTLGMVND